MYRQQRVRHICEIELKRKPLNLTADPDAAFTVLETRLRNSFCNEDFQFIASFIYEIEKSSWRKVFANLYNNSPGVKKLHGRLDNGLIPIEDDGHISPYRVSKKLIMEKVSTFYNVIIVCHPLCRLINSYQYTFENLDDMARSEYAHRKARLIAKVLNNVASEEKVAPTVSFIDFLQFVVNDRLFGADNYNARWAPMFRSHDPCDHYFDLIAHTETLKEDMDYLFEVLQIQKLVKYPMGHSVEKCNRTVFEDYFSSVPDDLFLDVVKMYEYDLKVYGYHFPCDVKDMLAHME